MVTNAILKLIALKNDTYICLFIMLAPKQTDFESFTEFEFRRRRTSDKVNPDLKKSLPDDFFDSALEFNNSVR